MIAVFCIVSMVLALLAGTMAYRALKHRNDLKNDASYFKIRIVFHALLLLVWCFGVKFLFVLTSTLLTLLIDQHLMLVIALTWVALVTYPVTVVVSFLGLWRSLSSGQPFEYLVSYAKLPARGLFPIILLWAAVFFIWNIVH